MPKYFSNEQQWLGNVIPSPAGDEALGGRKRVYRATINLDAPKLSQTTAGAGVLTTDTVSLCVIPPMSRFVRGWVTTSVSLGTSTIAVGTATTPAKYRAAAVQTAVDAPTVFGGALAMAAAPLAIPEEIIMTTAVANLPVTAGARLVIDMEFIAP